MRLPTALNHSATAASPSAHRLILGRVAHPFNSQQSWVPHPFHSLIVERGESTNLKASLFLPLGWESTNPNTASYGVEPLHHSARPIRSRSHFDPANDTHFTTRTAVPARPNFSFAPFAD
jgi:hypothetical protein